MDILVGLDYDTCDLADEELGKGHHTIQRKGVTLHEIIEELKDILVSGSHYPQFPTSAHPEVVYAYDLSQKEDADILGQIDNLLTESLRSNNGSNH